MHIGSLDRFSRDCLPPAIRSPSVEMRTIWRRSALADWPGLPGKPSDLGSIPAPSSHGHPRIVTVVAGDIAPAPGQALGPHVDPARAAPEQAPVQAHHAPAVSELKLG